jgi:peptidoglycan/xylan/chitin deacetylase (PgdA/CDA1 family)
MKNLIKLLLIAAIVGVIVIFVINQTQLTQENNVAQVNTTAQSSSEAPVLTLANPYDVIAVGTEYKPKATATDDIDGDISDKIVVDKTPTEIGEYEVNISVTDSNGNTTTLPQKVYVREKISKGLPICMYHFFYDNEKYFKVKGDANWLDINMFDKQLKYLTENHFYFPTWQEVEDYIDGKIELPAQSIVLTADDGDPSFFDLAVPLLEKYNVKMTSFVVTGWYGYRAEAQNRSKYVYYESHTDECHVAGEGGRGRITTISYEKACEDLSTSARTLGGSTAFAYPFGHYNDSSIRALKATGYKLAVTVEGGRVQPGANKYQLPRVRVADGNSLQYFIKCVE